MTIKVLVVDDNDMNLTLVSKILEIEGYQVITACNGKMAIQAFIQNKPDMAILDVMMPDIDGYDLCRKLRGAPFNTEIPILLLTAMSSDLERKHALEAGANDVWAKPFDMEVFKKKVGELLKHWN